MYVVWIFGERRVTLDFIIITSTCEGDTVFSPIFDVVSRFKSITQAAKALKQVNYNERIVNNIKDIITRDSTTDNDKAIIQCLKEILDKNQ